MKHFTIENETNNITVHGSAKEADAAPNTEHFSNEAGLAKLAADWPISRSVEIFNSLPGVTPVRKFTDRKTAVTRIWKGLQNFAERAPGLEIASAEVPHDPPVAPQTPDVATEPALSKQMATRQRKAPKVPAVAPREGSKTNRVSAMLKREGGVPLDEIATLMGWQKHTTRAMLSAGGSLAKNHGLVILSQKIGDRRTYSIRAYVCSCPVP